VFYRIFFSLGTVEMTDFRWVIVSSLKLRHLTFPEISVTHLNS